MKQRSALVLAAVLAATVLTGGAAILGIARAPAPVNATPTAAVVQAAQPAPQHWEDGGD
jgi:hypothetical protein